MSGMELQAMGKNWQGWSLKDRQISQIMSKVWVAFRTWVIHMFCGSLQEWVKLSVFEVILIQDW